MSIKISKILKSILISWLITVPCFAVLALILTFTDFPENFIAPAVTIVTILSIFVAAMFGTAGKKNNGWLHGVLVGFLYVVSLYIISSIVFGNFAIDRYILTTLLIGVLTGALGGMTGINIRTPA